MNENMNLYAEPLRNEMDKLELVYKEHTTSRGATVFTIDLPGENISRMLFAYFVRKTGQCTIHHIMANKIAKHKHPAVLELLNRFNVKQRYIKFSLDTDGDVIAEFEYILPEVVLSDSDEAGMHMFSMLVLMQDTIDEYAPDLLQLLWKLKSEQASVNTALFEQILSSYSGSGEADADDTEEDVSN